MKKTTMIWALLLCSGMVMAGTEQMKLYEVKSGKIDYSIKGSGDIMGQKIRTVGKKRVIFDDYGARNLTEENKIEKQVIMGQKQINKTHTMTYLKNGVAYQVDFNAKRIVRMPQMGALMGMASGGQKDVGKAGMEMMKKMGGKKIGTDKVLGYSCDVWELMGTKQCIYKGIPLKVESNVMGIKNTEVATKAEFDISVDDAFTLPDFPIYDMYGNKVNKSELASMDKQAQAENLQVQEGMAQMQDVITSAAKEAGIEEGKEMTQSQEKAFENAMMQAMLPQMKQQILQEEGRLKKAYACFSDADTKKEAKACIDLIEEEGGEPAKELGEWTSKEKEEMLEYLDTYLKRILPCVKSAQTMDALQQCIPEE